MGATSSHQRAWPGPHSRLNGAPLTWACGPRWSPGQRDTVGPGGAVGEGAGGAGGCAEGFSPQSLTLLPQSGAPGAPPDSQSLPGPDAWWRAATTSLLPGGPCPSPLWDTPTFSTPGCTQVPGLGVRLHPPRPQAHGHPPFPYRPRRGPHLAPRPAPWGASRPVGPSHCLCKPEQKLRSTSCL